VNALLKTASLCLISTRLIAAPDAAPLSGESLFDSVERYAAFGEHRTGTPADHATADWLERELTGNGFAIDEEGG